MATNNRFIPSCRMQLQDFLSLHDIWVYVYSSGKITEFGTTEQDETKLDELCGKEWRNEYHRFIINKCSFPNNGRYYCSFYKKN